MFNFELSFYRFNFDGSAVAEEPEFTHHIDNVTVPAGRNVKMACSVKNLGSFKVTSKKKKKNNTIKKYVFPFQNIHFPLSKLTN